MRMSLTQLPHLAQNGNDFRPDLRRKLLIANEGTCQTAM
jgi:hypothetical protein